MRGVGDHHVQRAPVGSTECGCDRPPRVDRDAVGDGATRDDAEELAGVIAADPYARFSVDAQAVGVPVGAEVGENAWCTKGAVRLGGKRENPGTHPSR